MAELVGYFVDNAKDTVVDTFIGIAIITAAIVGVAVCGVCLSCCAGTVFGVGNTGSGLDKKFLDLEQGQDVPPKPNAI